MAIEALRAHAAALPNGLADDDPRAIALYEECERVFGLESIVLLNLIQCYGGQWLVSGGLDGLLRRIERIAERLGQR